GRPVLRDCPIVGWNTRVSGCEEGRPPRYVTAPVRVRRRESPRGWWCGRYRWPDSGGGPSSVAGGWREWRSVLGSPSFEERMPATSTSPDCAPGDWPGYRPP